MLRGYKLVLEGPTVSVGFVVDCVAQSMGLFANDPTKRKLGKLVHEKVEQELKGSKAVASVEEVYESRNLGLRGAPDLVLKDGTPVEIKSGAVPQKGVYFLHRVQLCLYALLLEDVLGWDIDRGFVYYAKTKEWREVTLDEQIRRKSLKLLRKAKKLKAKKEVCKV
ncbi:CRISPR-associated protein Cas4 [Candidatus Marsarchaeota G1 archaeon OSP_C]|uniref:CRISPR-associated exonuclease Cas4 n=1 Tax=Candidatus Marsarchaeota G1 archaeon OSP_C TaxID=1978154 RepID=A0A2R6AHJ1_9ARCH|nr:MAG: CRISPR-associated protein Cas4 [Candidatus Marsarchaeota G1 archaeon OSP_C]